MSVAVVRMYHYAMSPLSKTCACDVIIVKHPSTQQLPSVSVELFTTCVDEGEKTTKKKSDLYDHVRLFFYMFFSVLFCKVFFFL